MNMRSANRTHSSQQNRIGCRRVGHVARLRRMHAATRTWDGGGGANTLWSTAANWDGPDTKPVSGDDANIPGNFSLTINGGKRRRT